MTGLIDDLLRSDAVAGIIVINDGSDATCAPVFRDAAARPRTEVLCHVENLGKGAALRTGIRRFLECATADEVLVTADADGQHLPGDILAVAVAGMENTEGMVLGTRAFRGGAVPLRSRFGNDLTRLVFRAFTGLALTDTQTGLRAIPRCLLEPLLRVKTSRYAFELEMLLMAARARIPFVAVPIETVYLEGNVASHFRPVTDSARVYWVFARHLFRRRAQEVMLRAISAQSLPNDNCHPERLSD
ncbi:MAG: glycosyltransferase family 2 protein [Verrucomicrobiaceae bacterium]|nr:glycosyltransferase family 2 protein [Verrucomicrobiaceae bacterium]